MLKLTPKMSGSRTDGTNYYAYNVVGSESEIENYIRIVTTCKNYPTTIEKITAEDGSITFFSNRLIASDNSEILLSENFGAYTKNPLKKSMGAVERDIQAQVDAGRNPSYTLTRKLDILIEQDLAQEAIAQREMDKAMSDFRNSNNSQEDVAPKTKSKAKAKAVAGDDEDLV